MLLFYKFLRLFKNSVLESKSSYWYNIYLAPYVKLYVKERERTSTNKRYLRIIIIRKLNFQTFKERQ